MIEESDALQTILQTTPSPTVERRSLDGAAGMFLCEELRAQVPLPGFDQSAMDGYALRSADLVEGKGRFRVAGSVAAGEGRAVICGEGEAVRVFTGAPLPDGADTVVMQEDVRREDDHIDLSEGVEAGEFVRCEGEVICRGQRVGAPGDRLDAGRIGLLSSQGIGEVSIGAAPRVAILTTGDELVEPGGELSGGQVFNSNGPMLHAAANGAGALAVQRSHARDDLAATAAEIRSALKAADVLLIAGGVSVGERDFVKPALAECGIEPTFWRVRVRPGKPLLYATTPSGQQIFGLPGNPVSALVCFTVFVLPALRHRLGALGENGVSPRVWVTLRDSLINATDRPHYVRGKIDAEGQFCPTGLQESHGLTGIADASALVRVCASGKIVSGERVEAYLFLF